MIVLRIALPLYIPIFDAANDVSFVRRTKLYRTFASIQGLEAPNRYAPRAAVFFPWL
jgi:hypothetical protein